MTARAGRLFLIAVAATLIVAAIVFCIDPPRFAWTPLPNDSKQLAERIAAHPADWRASNALAETALDMRAENRVAVWRAAYRHAALLSAERPETANAFARGAFFHWNELTPQDQRDALAAFAPLLRDTGTFMRMAKPLFELTGNLSFLKAAHPQTPYAIGTLMALAVPNGFFADYRELRGELQRTELRDFEAVRRTAAPEELLVRFPDPPYHSDAEPLIVALLEELHRRPLDDDPHRAAVVDALVAYALRHDLEPLDGLEALTHKRGAASVATQIALARKLGNAALVHQLELGSNDPRRVAPVTSEWQGLCNTDVCSSAWRTIEAVHGLGITIETVQTDNILAYVEIYVDDALRGEGEVGPKRDFILPVGTDATHRVEVVLANPLTRNRFQRRVHIAAITPL